MPFRGDTEHYRRLQVITDTALAHLDLDVLLAELLVRIRDVLEVDTCAILLLDDANQELVARAVVGLDKRVEHGVRVKIGTGFAGRIVSERRPIVLDDPEMTIVLNPVLRDKGIKTLLGVPLEVRGAVIGVLHVGMLSPREWGEADVDLLQRVADRSALAIEHANLFNAERQARQRLEHVQAITDAALMHLGLDDLLTELLVRTHDVLDVDTCVILLLDESTRELVPRAAVGIEGTVEQGLRIPLGQGFAGRVAAERKPVVLDDVKHAGVLNRLLVDKGIESMLGVPLVARDEAIGVLHVGTLESRTFGDDDVQLLQLVAERAAVAIERARLLDEAVLLDQLKLNFVSIASHELRAPATAIFGALTTLRARGDALTPEIKTSLADIAWEQADRLRRLIEQLLDLSRLDAHSIDINPVPLDLHRLLSEVVKAAGGAPSEVTLNVDPELAVVADPLVIDRVVTNLVANARNYGRPPIDITAEQYDSHLRLTVEDAGAGIADDLLPRLFERFERGGEGVGSGLGLSIARAYAQAHGGDLVYGRSDHGARFELTLPLG